MRPDGTEQTACTDGMCNVDTCTAGCSSGTWISTESDCTANSGTWETYTWEPATWVTYNEVTTRSTCEAAGTGHFCSTCSKAGDYSTDESCLDAGGTITDLSGTYGTENECKWANAKCQYCSVPASSYGDCMNKGTCKDPSGSVKSDKNSQGACTGCDDCGACSDGGTSKSGCESPATWADNTWEPATVTNDADPIFVSFSDADEDTCRDKGDSYWVAKENWWTKKRAFIPGTAIPGPPMVDYTVDGTCATGKTCAGSCFEHLEGGEFSIRGIPGDLLYDNIMGGDSSYVSDEKFMTAVNAGATAAEASSGADSSYFEALKKWFIMVNSKVVDVNVSGASKQGITFEASGLIPLMYPSNLGTIKAKPCGVTGAAACPGTLKSTDQHLFIYKPVNLAGDNSLIDIDSGKVTVIGGSNSGEIDMSTTEDVKISGITNTGTVSISNSQGVIIGGLPNSGAITFTDTITSFVDVVNEEAGTVTINAGTYSTYNTVNKGTITLKSGAKVGGHIKCNTGTIAIEKGATGSITIGAGDCQGTVTNAGEVAITYESKTEYVVSQSLTFGGTGVTAAKLDTTSGKKAIAESIASALGVTSASVDIISITDASRRLASGHSRRLSSSVQIDYTVTVTDPVARDSAKTTMEAIATAPATNPEMDAIVEVVALEAGIEVAAITPTAEAPSVETVEPVDNNLDGAATAAKTSAVMAVVAGVAGAAIVIAAA